MNLHFNLSSPRAPLSAPFRIRFQLIKLCLSKRSGDPAIGALWNVYPVECAAYSTGVGGTIVLGPAPQRPVKFMAMRSEAHLTRVAPADGTGARDIIINSQ